MNTIWFIIKDGITGLNRSKFSTFLTLTSLTITLTFIALFYIFSQNVLAKINELHERMTLEAFIDVTYTNPEILELQSKILTFAEIDSIQYISKDEALERFKKVFAVDYAHLIEENPLPASFRIFIRPDNLGPISVPQLEKQLRELKGITDVVFHRRMLTSLNYYYSSAKKLFLLAGIALLIVSFVLIWVNMKFLLRAKQKIIETLELVGARKMLIAGPFYIHAALEGIFAGCVAVALIKVIFWFSGLNFYLIVNLTNTHTIGLILLGMVYAILGCFTALLDSI